MPKNHVPAAQYLGSSLPAVAGAGAAVGGRIDDKLIDDHLAVQAIIRSYQVIFTQRIGLLILSSSFVLIPIAEHVS